MGWDNETLNDIYDKTDGYCRYCGKKIAWKNYGQRDERGAWEVDHSVPKALGGTDYFHNLWPACIECNRMKGTMKGPEFERMISGPEMEPEVSLGDIIVTIGTAIVIGAFASALSKRN